MAGATWDAQNGFQPNVPMILDSIKSNLEANNMTLIDDC